MRGVLVRVGWGSSEGGMGGVSVRGVLVRVGWEGCR